MGKRVLFGLLAGIVALGMKFYNKSSPPRSSRRTS